MNEKPIARWQNIREKGSIWGMLFTAKVYRLLGRWAAEPILWVIVFYFFLKDRRTRGASRQYLKRISSIKADLRKPGWWDVYRHHLSFARTSLDRFDVWTNRLDDYTFYYHGEENVTRLLEQGRGAVLIGAHLGNFDTLRALGKRRGGKIHILTDRRNSQKFSQILRRFCPDMDEGIVEYEPGAVETIFELKQAIERGEFVGLLGDRIGAVAGRGLRRVSSATFLGASASFPQAPFLFAAHLECPVLLLFALRRAHRIYDFYVEPFAERIDLPEAGRDEALNQYAAAFAARLEYYCLKSPMQWFNFYDFWGKQS